MPTQTLLPSRANNFDLIRILAALQVVLGHGVHHLKIEGGLAWAYNEILKYFPGVPIFFFVSGFLITWSFDRDPSAIKAFFYKRLLRIYPALWACTIICGLLLLAEFSGQFSTLALSKQFLIWLAGQLTVFQYYTPDALRFWGVGAPNGSLWTISVELQFYVALPILYWMMRRYRMLFFIVVALSIACNAYMTTLDQSDVVVKLLAVSVLPYLYYFGIGVLSFFSYSVLKPYIEGKFLHWLIAYGVLVGSSVFAGFEVHSYWIHSPLSLFADVVLGMVTLSAAYTIPTLSEKILKGNDISYGVYIYHMLVINVLVHHNLTGSALYLLVAFSITLILAFLSWRLIEKPALSLKEKLIT